MSVLHYEVEEDAGEFSIVRVAPSGTRLYAHLIYADEVMARRVRHYLSEMAKHEVRP